MSKDDRQRKIQQKPIGDDPAIGDRPDPSYDVGYRKPPKQTRFSKGTSGNPKGRPRKKKPRQLHLSDAPSDRFLDEEAYRPISLRENGEVIELPVTQAVFRSLAMTAIKGNRLAMKQYLEHVARKEEEHQQSKIQHYLRLEELKLKGERILTDHREWKKDPPNLLPHPDDIVLSPVTYDAYVNGPATPQEEKHYEHAVALRDHLLLCGTETFEKSLRKKASEKTYSLYVVLAQLLDRFLPQRYRWKREGKLEGDHRLMMEYMCLHPRERRALIAEQFARLQETEPPPVHVTPEIKERIQQASSQFLRRIENLNRT